MKLKRFTIGALALIGAGEIIRRVVQGTAGRTVALRRSGRWAGDVVLRHVPGQPAVQAPELRQGRLLRLP